MSYILKRSSLLEAKGTSVEFTYLIHATPTENIQYCIRALLLTRRQERTIDGFGGSRIYDFLFRELTQDRQKELKSEILAMLEAGEPRVKVKEIIIDSNPSVQDRFGLAISYQIKSSKQEGIVKVEVKA